MALSGGRLLSFQIISKSFAVLLVGRFEVIILLY